MCESRAVGVLRRSSYPAESLKSGTHQVTLKPRRNAEAGGTDAVIEQGTKTRVGRRRLVFRFVTVAVAILIAVALAEGLVRIYVLSRGWTPNCYAGSVQLLVPEETNGYELASSFRLRSGIYAISTNRYGLRGPEISMRKPPGTTRIAILGGSSVFGYLVSDSETAARRLEQHLRVAGAEVEVLNAGVPGYNLFQTTHRFRNLISRFEVDLVVLYLGWNDLTYVVSDTPAAPRFQRGEPYPSWQRWLSASTLYGLFAFRLLSPDAVFVPPAATRAEPTTAGAEQFRKNLAALIRDIRESGAVPVICSQVTAARSAAPDPVRAYLGATAAQQEQNAALGRWLHRTLRDVAEAEDLQFIDAAERLTTTAEVLGDAVHLTDAGEAALANLLQEELSPLLSAMHSASQTGG